jgi:phosphate-selective porin OprO/OprP
LDRDEGRKLVHLGLAYSRRKPLDGLFRLRARPEAHLAPFFADTGSFSGTTLHLLGTEAALVVNRASLQSEYVHVFVNRPDANRANFSSFYLQGSYFLTGEHRVYEAGEGLFGRVRPNRDFEAGPGKGWGAWELVARYSRIDLADDPIFGGRLQDVTLGMTWYLNPSTKILWNYVSADRIDVGRADIFQTRFQVDF